MTEQEAKEILTLSDNEQKELPMLKEVYAVAINALEEIQQYRAIGTVEEFSSALKNVKTLSRMYEKLNNQEVSEYHKLNQYEAIGTVEECREAMRKQKAVCGPEYLEAEYVTLNPESGGSQE